MFWCGSGQAVWRIGDSGRLSALSNNQHVVIVMRDVRHVAERLPHALAEGVDRRAERVF